MKGARGKFLFAAMALWALGLAAGPAWPVGDRPDSALRGETLRISGRIIHTWRDRGVRVFEIVGNARIQQGDYVLAATNAVVWLDEEEATRGREARCGVYAEVGVHLIRGAGNAEKVERYEQYLTDFITTAGITVDGGITAYEAPQDSPLFSRAKQVIATQMPGFGTQTPVPPQTLRPAVSEPPEELEISADNVDSWVEGDTRIVVATGNVKIRKYVRKSEKARLKKGESPKDQAPAGLGVDTGESYELNAERVVLWIPVPPGEKGVKTGKEIRQVYAEGDVTLYRDEDVLRADRVFENRVENKGLMTNAELRTMDPSRRIPFVFRADEVRQLDSQRFVARNGSITTDPYGRPHFKFKGQVVRLVQGKRSTVVNSTHNTFQIGNVPVAYWPFFSKDLKDDSWMIKDAAAGYSRGFGAFFLTEWDLYDLGIYRNDWSEASLRLDAYTRRGLGLGPSFEYVTDTGFGFLQGYYIHDAADYDRSGIAIDHSDRGRLLARHREFLPMDWRFDSEISFLSDRGFLDEYFHREFTDGKPQETVQYFRKLKDNAALTLLFQEKINDFEPIEMRDDLFEDKVRNFTVDSYLESPLYDTTAQKFPELGYHQIGQPLFGGLMNYSTNTRFDAVSLKYDRDMLERLELDTPQGFVPLRNPPTLARLDTKHDLSIQGDIGPVRVEQMFSTRLQGFSHSIDEQSGEEDGAWARVIAGPQITASANFWRIYDVHNQWLDIHRLKHIVTPMFRYENAAFVTDGPDRFYNLDPYSTVRRDPIFTDTLTPLVPLPRSFNDFTRVESMDHMERVVFELRQRLQTKRGPVGREETVDLAELRLDYTAFPGNEGLNRQFKDVYGNFIRLDAFWQLSKNVLFESRGNEINTTTGELEVANIGVNLAFPPDWNLYLGQRYIRDARERDPDNGLYDRISRNVSILGLEYTVSPKYAVTFVQQYDFTKNRNMTTKVIVSRKLPGWLLDLSADVNPTDKDTSLSVSLTPLGLRQGVRRFW